MPHRDAILILLAECREPAVQVGVAVLFPAVVCRNGHSSHGTCSLKVWQVHVQHFLQTVLMNFEVLAQVVAAHYHCIFPPNAVFAGAVYNEREDTGVRVKLAALCVGRTKFKVCAKVCLDNDR